MIDKKQVGKRIALNRTRHKLSQAALAERLGITTQAVSKWETGLALPDVELLMELSWLFGLSLNALLEGGDPFPSRKPRGEEWLAGLSSYYSTAELDLLGALIRQSKLRVTMSVEAAGEDERDTVQLPIDSLPPQAVAPFSEHIARAVSFAVDRVDRGLLRAGDLLACPQCKEPLNYTAEHDQEKFRCVGGHEYSVIDGVISFGMREIHGEQWSMCYRNYEQFAEELQSFVPSEHMQKCMEVYSAEFLRRRPRVVLDIGSGMASMIGELIRLIHWPCLILLTDLSHRILKWDRQYINEHINNPNVTLIYLECDCAHLPLRDECIDLVASGVGFESMQAKWAEGYREAVRALKSDGTTLYMKPFIESKDSPNSQKWMQLLSKDPDYYEKKLNEMMVDPEEWQHISQSFGFAQTEIIHINHERPAPEGDEFPYENEVAQWMRSAIVVSRK